MFGARVSASEKESRVSGGKLHRKPRARGVAPVAVARKHEAGEARAAEGALNILTAIGGDELNHLSKRQLIKVIEDLFAMLARTENEREKRFEVILGGMLHKQEEKKRTTREKEGERLKQDMYWLDERRKNMELMAKECERERAACTIQSAMRSWWAKLQQGNGARGGRHQHGQLAHTPLPLPLLPQRPADWSPRQALKQMQAEAGPSFERYRKARESRRDASSDFDRPEEDSLRQLDRLRRLAERDDYFARDHYNT